jgi:hypothetical protein
MSPRTDSRPLATTAERHGVGGFYPPSPSILKDDLVYES